MTGLRFISFTSMLLIAHYGCQTNLPNSNEKAEKLLKTLNENIGERFEVDNILDSSGKLVSLDFTNSEITIIDFWFKECPPCLEEMEQFAEIIKGKEKEISIVSISINQFWNWKSILEEPNGMLAFLANALPNWKQYTLQTSDNPKFKNWISSDRTKELQKRYSVSFFPAYFVVNKSGKILSRPKSAVEFIKQYNETGTVSL
jgi:thiol-disulfide isomerase/thioredoxin